jgi:4-amino-4-deoxy-L-arabinose transferase-like glycosyltransferase
MRYPPRPIVPLLPPLPASRKGTVGLAFVLVILLCGLPLFAGLGDADAENDEAGYFFVVDTMLARGDWLTPRSIPNPDVPFLEKPPLKFWLVAAPIKLGLLPHSEWGMRVLDALFGVIALGYVFALGRRLDGPLAGFAAAMLLFAHRQLIFEHGLRTNNMEASVLLCYCGGMYHFLRWRDERGSPAARRQATALSLYFVLGFMTKFVAALFLPMVCGVALLVGRAGREALRVGWRTLVPGGLVAVALIVPWFVYQYARVGRQLVDTMFLTHVVTRFTSTLGFRHLKPWDYYATSIADALGEAQILTLTMAGVAWLLYRAIRGETRDAAPILIWAALPLVLISLGAAKVYHYAYPFLPPLALAGGCAVVLVARLLMAAFDWVFGPREANASGLAFGRGLIVTLICAAVLPLNAYVMNVHRTRANPHPVRDMGDCLRNASAGASQTGASTPGIWAEGRADGWVYFYYWHGLGHWEERDTQSDATVLLNITTPASFRPVFIVNTRFDEVMKRVQAGDPALVELLARRTGTSAEAFGEVLRQAEVGMMRFPQERLLLPGPYRSCGNETLKLARRVP